MYKQPLSAWFLHKFTRKFPLCMYDRVHTWSRWKVMSW
jgi:hypothetical protein